VLSNELKTNSIQGGSKKVSTVQQLTFSATLYVDPKP